MSLDKNPCRRFRTRCEGSYVSLFAPLLCCIEPSRPLAGDGEENCVAVRLFDVVEGGFGVRAVGVRKVGRSRVGVREEKRRELGSLAKLMETVETTEGVPLR